VSEVIHLRGQVSFEMIAVVSALIMISLVVFTISAGGNTNLINIQNTVAAKRDAYSYAAAMNFVYLAGDGASYDFSTKNLREDENISISGYAVTADRGSASVSVPLLDGKTNTSTPAKGHMTITNDKGEIDFGK